MTEEEFTKIVGVWTKLSLALSTFYSPESHFPKGKENFLKMKIEEAYIIIDEIVAKGK